MNGRMSRFPVAMAGLALVAATAGACGSDDGDDTTASDPGASSTPRPSASDTVSGSPSASASTEPPIPDVTSSPIIDKAAKDAIKAKFPAMVTAEIPTTYTVVDATFDPAGGGSWTIHIIDQNGDPITLVQTTDSVEDLVAATVGAEARKTGTVNLKDFGLGVWKQFEGGSQLAIARALSDTSVVVTGATQSQAVSIAQTQDTGSTTADAHGGAASPPRKRRQQRRRPRALPVVERRRSAPEPRNHRSRLDAARRGIPMVEVRRRSAPEPRNHRSHAGTRPPPIEPETSGRYQRGLRRFRHARSRPSKLGRARCSTTIDRIRWRGCDQSPSQNWPPARAGSRSTVVTGRRTVT